MSGTQEVLFPVLHTFLILLSFHPAVLVLPVQVIGTVYRSRYYFAWSMGHSSLALAGMDFLKWEPVSKDSSEVKGVWGRCRNAQPFKVEFCDSSRLLAGYWNTTTGNFLRRWVMTGADLSACPRVCL
jgi:hypothetical protein